MQVSRLSRTRVKDPFVRSCLFFSLFFSTLTAPLFSAELYDEKKVSHIEIVVDAPSGTSNQGSTSSKSLLSRLKTQEGDDFSQLTFDSDLKTLSEEYEKVEPSIVLKDDELFITIHVTPRPVIHQIVWSGNSHYKTSTLQGELDVEPNTPFNRAEFNKAFNKVKEFYFKKGYFESQLSYSVEPISGTNEVDIQIEVREGRPGHIKKIVFSGFTAEERSALSDQMFLKKYNFITSWLTGDGIYRDEALEQDRMTILNYLHNEGYADAKVTIQLSEDPESGKLIIYITAEKGELYHVGGICYEGYSLLSLADIEKRANLSCGDIFSPEKVRDAAQAIKELYGQKGYIDASVQYETRLRENEPIFDLEFFIDEGQQYKIGLIHIFGNSSTKNNVILRESLLVPGETFDARKLRATQQRLEAIGYFKSVNVYAVRSPDDECLGPGYRDVYIEVEETTTGSISLFIGFSSMDDVFGGLDLTERNFNLAGVAKAIKGDLSALRGGGEFFHVRGTLGVKQNNVLISWLNPYVNDSLWRLGFELSRTYSRLQNNVKVTTYGGSVYTNYPLSNYWTAGLRQRLRHSKDDLQIDPVGSSPAAIASVQTVKNQLDQKGLVSAFSGNLNYDSTDSAYKPHKGWRSYFEAEVAGVWGGYDFLKFSYLNSIYLPVWSKGTIKLRGDFKYIFPFGKTGKNSVPYSERFFLGGETTVRGYRPFLLGPVVELLNDQGQYQQTDTPYGGLSSSMASLEYNQEIIRMVDVFAFIDAGSLTFGEFDWSHVRATIGAGVRIDIGNRVPVMVGYGFPLDRADRNSDRWQKVFFSMGGQF